VQTKKNAWQQDNEARTKELTDKLEAGIKDLFSSDKYRDYLKSMSHFHNYSSRNVMLIHQQLPGATRVASYKLWAEKFNRQVKKGEKGLRIFAPIEIKPEKKLMEKLDPETGAPMLGKDGKVIMEEMTALSSRSVAFKLVPVFDVSQTYGDPLPQLAEDLTGNVEHYEAFLDSLKAISPLPIEFEPMNENQDGYCRYGVKIGIREGMSEIQTVSAIIHEITHARLHGSDKAAENETTTPKEVKEIEAESVSYVVCQKYGIETGDNSFGYLAAWGSHDLNEVKDSLDTIRKEANSLINAIDDRFKIICKERGIDLTTAEQSADAPVPTQETEKSAEPAYTTESTTETIAGVDFVVEEIKPILPEKEQPLTIEQQNYQKDTELLPQAEPSEHMPDATIGVADRDAYGYTAEELLPIKIDRAVELFEQDHTIYLLYPDNTEAMAFDVDEIKNHDGIFGIEREDWQKSAEYRDMDNKHNTPAVEQSDNDPPAPELPDIPKREQPIYKQTFDYALEHGELQALHDSRDLNVECGKAIDNAVIASNYEEHRYDLKSAIRDVVEEYGADRVSWVLASNVNHHNFDGRLTSASKDWAKGFDTPEPDIHLQSHMILVEGLVDNFRKIEKEKPSIMSALSAGEKKSKSEFDGKAQPELDAIDKSSRKKNTGVEV